MRSIASADIDNIIARVPIAVGQSTPFRAALERGDCLAALGCVPRGMAEKSEGGEESMGLPPRLAFLAEIGDKLDGAEYAHVLRVVWTTSEKYVDDMIFETLFGRSRQGTALLAITPQERQFLNALPDPFLIYRGCTESTREGYCWTSTRTVAEDFAATHAAENDETAEVLERWCPKDAVRAIYHNAGEFEVVVSPAELRQPSGSPP